MNNEEPFSVSSASLSGLFNANEAYAIPLYQRPYVWQAEQNQRLWEDMVQSFESDASHFLGSIVLTSYQKDDYSSWRSDDLANAGIRVWHVVDGQQRLTSMSLLLAALYWDMRGQLDQLESFSDYDAEFKADWHDQETLIRQYLRTNVKNESSDFSGNIKIPRLIPVRAIYSHFEKIINKGDCGRKTRLDKAYDLYRQALKKFREDKYGQSYEKLDNANELFSFYTNLLRTITRNIRFAKITCAEGQDPFQVFESLNGTGVNLSAADRIKNTIMGLGHSQGMKQADIADSWNEIAGNIGVEKDMEGFLSAYMFVHEGKRVSRGNLYDAFKNGYLNDPLIAGRVKAAIADLKTASKQYGHIVKQISYHDDQTDKDVVFSPAVKATVKAIMKNNRKQAVVPLLASARQYGFSDSFDAIADKLLTLLIRHKVCQRPTNELDRIFGSYCNTVKNETAAEAIAFLDSYRRPNAEFEKHFAELTFDDNEIFRANYYLHEIENYLRGKYKHDGKLNDDEEYTVEHIIPQTLKVSDWFAGNEDKISELEDEDSPDRVEFFETTVKSIGNMCLLRRSENASASNKNYEGKKSTYKTLEGNNGEKADATFMLVHQLENNTIDIDGDSIQIVEEGGTFDEGAVQRRAQALAQYALEIW